jgi:threonylcarbamoyladenosine tRNA methylthiotransferase MtaB
LNDEIIDFVAKSQRFAPHFHIPLQSGSDKILKLMRRRYERQLYADRVLKIKSLMPDCCIGVDVIVGFPGESDEDFMDTYNFLNELPVSYLHVFTYSERANTTAIRSTEVVPMEIRNKRSKMLHILSEKKKRAFYETQLNKFETVLFEADEEEGYMNGFTSNYVKVKTKFEESLVNQLAEVQLKSIDGNGIMDITLEKILIPQIAG